MKCIQRIEIKRNLSSFLKLIVVLEVDDVSVAEYWNRVSSKKVDF
jgi:hypothetical protein